MELGAEIYTDFWRGYNRLKLYYKHRVVNKQMKGYGTSEYETTNRVEGLWSEIKRSMVIYHSYDISKLQRFLDEMIWRRKYKKFDERIDFLV